MTVSDLVNDAFDQALLQHEELYKSWIDISIQLGGRVIRFSLLGTRVHDIGLLDIVLRCMENETKAVIDSARESGSKVELPMAHWYQNMLSQIWVSETYEVFRLLKQRELVQESDTFDELANHLRLLRITFDKHELANDRALIKNPALLQKTNILNRYHDLSGYDANDQRKAHILNSRNTPLGSIEWEALDLNIGETIWLERLSLSERVLEIFQKEELLCKHE